VHVNHIDTAFNREPPPFPRLFLNDVAIFVAVVFPVVLWCLHGLNCIAARLDNAEPDLPTGFFVIATAIGSTVALWKLSVIRALFRNGRVTKGVVTDCFINSTCVRIEFEFDADGILKRGVGLMTRHKRVNLLPPGWIVSVLYDPTCPRRSLVREMFDDRPTAQPDPK